MRLLLDHKLLFALLTGLLVGLQLTWDFAHGGIPTHYLLARDDLPGFSNLWGLLTLPALSWLMLSLVQRRVRHSAAEAHSREISRAGYAMLGAFLFGAVVALLWELRQEAVLQYLILLPLPLALLMPVSRPEQLLGFVLGMSYTFGGVLPIIVGLVLMTLGAVIHYGLRGGVRKLLVRRRNGKAER